MKAFMAERYVLAVKLRRDEPEAALSPSRQLAMISRIHQLVQKHSQFVIATHSPLLMAYPNAWIYRIGDNAVECVILEETEHYAVARRFLNDPHGQLARLLACDRDDTRNGELF